MADETTTTTNGNENSEVQTTSGNPEQASSSSTTETPATETPQAETETDEDSIDLGKGKTDTTETDTVEETDEEKATREAREALFGPPAEGEDYKLEGLPDGTTIDAEALAAISPVARELGLSSAGLSKIAQVYAEKVLPGVAERFTKDLAGDITEQRAAWEAEARHMIRGQKVVVDAEGNPVVENGKAKVEEVATKNGVGKPLSFDGRKMDDVQRIAAKALDHLAPEGFRAWLDETGLGVHPMVVAFAYQAGKNIAEETEFEQTATSANREKAREEKYYG